MTGAETTSPIFCVTGLERSGTIWTTRLLADSLGLQSRTRDFPYDTYKKDAVVWGLDRDAPYIRRVHYYPSGLKFSCPVVMVVRDPRDVAVSQAYFYRYTDNKFDSHMRWLAPQWGGFIREWEQDSRLASTLTYESLHLDAVGTIARVISDLDMVVAIADIKNAVAANEFAAMENWTKRKGTIGEWRVKLSPGVANRACRSIMPLMRRFGYA